MEEEFWKILVADDDGGILLVSEMALRDLEFEGKKIQIYKAMSAENTLNILRNEKDIAVILLDVVMETMNAGLDIVPIIRNELKNHDVRIIIRTADTTLKNATNIILQYDINDFRKKLYLDNETLRNIVLLSLRNYRDIIRSKNATI